MSFTTADMVVLLISILVIFGLKHDSKMAEKELRSKIDRLEDDIISLKQKVAKLERKKRSTNENR